MIRTNYSGATTIFESTLTFNRTLDDDTYNLLLGLANSRRMKRDTAKLQKLHGHDFGIDGEFYTGDDYDAVVDVNVTPSNQPSLNMDWTVTEDRLHMEWTKREKTYQTVEWFEYLIEKILTPRGYTLNGIVNAVVGGEFKWHMVITDNEITVKRGHNKKCPIPSFRKWLDFLEQELGV